MILTRCSVCKKELGRAYTPDQKIVVEETLCRFDTLLNKKTAGIATPEELREFDALNTERRQEDITQWPDR